MSRYSDIVSNTISQDLDFWGGFLHYYKKLISIFLILIVNFIFVRSKLKVGGFLINKFLAHILCLFLQQEGDGGYYKTWPGLTSKLAWPQFWPQSWPQKSFDLASKVDLASNFKIIFFPSNFRFSVID